MNELAMRFSGGKDSTLAAVRIAGQYDRVHLLTFRQSMIRGTERSAVNIQKLRDVYKRADLFVHEIIDIGPLIEKFYYGGGYVGDVKKYGTLARTMLCTACDFSMFVRTVKYCMDNGIGHACDGANKGEFAGFLDKWGLPIIQDFARKYGVEWTFPVYDTDRCDIELLQAGLDADPPVIFSRSQAVCRGGGLFANIHLRCYYLPVHGVEKYEELTTAWLRDRIEMAASYMNQH